MLIYLANDMRDYHARPVSLHLRRGWEFQAVVDGSIGLVHETGPDILYKSRLWLSTPGFLHGWTGEKDKPAKVIVFHFRFIPELIESLLPACGYLEISLTREQNQRLQRLADQASAYWHRPARGATICFEHIMLELCMLVLANQKTAPVSPALVHAEQRVDAAITWFTERIAQNPGLNEVARAVATSPSNLRRIFQEVLQNSPKQVFDQIRYQRAMQLMSSPDIKLETVGESCGFGSASAFSRAFKTKFGSSPDAWRTTS